MYRIYRHSITPWGPREGQGKPHSALGTAALIPGKVLGGRRLGSQEHPHPVPVSAPLQLGSPSCASPSPNSLRRAPGAKTKERIMSLGARAPRLGEEIYTTEHRAHGRGRGHHGRGRGGRRLKRWMGRAPASPEEALLPGDLNKRRKSYNQRGGDGVEGEESSHLYTTL